MSVVLKKATRANLSDEQTRFSLINGLKDSIRQQVINHEPKTIQEVRKWSLVAESSGRGKESSDDLVSAVKSLVEQLGKGAIHEVATGNRERANSPAPRVRFDDNTQNIRGSSRERSTENYGANAGTEWHEGPAPERPVAGYGRGSWKGQGQTYSAYRGARGSQGGWRNQNTQRPTYAPSELSTQSSHMGGQDRLQSNYEGQCGYCGLFHTNLQRCPAAGKTCFNCNKINHFRSVCRYARGGQGSQH